MPSFHELIQLWRERADQYENRAQNLIAEYGQDEEATRLLAKAAQLRQCSRELEKRNQ